MQRLDFKCLLSSRVKRRQVLIGTGALAGLAIASQWSNKVIAQPRFSAYPFSLGVASGEPLPNGGVIKSDRKELKGLRRAKIKGKSSEQGVWSNDEAINR